MKRQRKPWLNSKDNQQIWRRWSEGESLSEIARGLQRDVSSIHRVVSEHGGIVPRAHSRSTRVLALRERDEISRGLSAGESIRQIAQRLQRAASTISREVQRNGGVLKYRAHEADATAWKRHCGPNNARWREMLVCGDWSPASCA